MSIELNHTIVHSRDRETSAHFLAGILGLEVGEPGGPFLPVVTGNNVTLDFATVDADTIAPQHYAFLVPESDFPAMFERIKAAGVAYFADPAGKRPAEINRNDGGYGVYFLDPSGHYLELLTRPYGSGDAMGPAAPPL
ncbi:VOC family protein [Streptomyces sp. ISL-11]|uniref:VOC family protein n=1 Tax=Streptomyces sp. ISL-11 TaxID=2819174 RepID=UPI001BE557E2|nr:VOC family protein [Streptomyces sp. ISL-11]MBT2384274.1 VOC family protein [Streptomyces sp. ISL-11]